MNSHEEFIEQMSEEITKEEAVAVSKMLTASTKLEPDNLISFLATFYWFTSNTKLNEKNEKLAAAMLLREVACDIDKEFLSKRSVHNSKYIIDILKETLFEYNENNVLPALFAVVNHYIKASPVDLEEGINSSIALLAKSNLRKPDETKH